MSADVETIIRKQEEVRCQALVAGDYDTLGAMMTEDLVHIHANGHLDNKADYLSGVQAKLEFKAVARPDLKIRVYGDIAVATGPLNQTIRVKANDVTVEMKGMSTIIWRLDGGDWRICGFQATNIA